ncbi:MAG: efflux RND transporter permease subunit [Bacteroidota bacterium]|nr:efflux RND transporter permease subunit [Bacteroidota bacterium]
MIWTALARVILRYRIVILILILGLTGFMAYQIQFLKLDYGYAGLLPDSHPVSVKLQEFIEEFGEDATIFLFGCEDEDFFQVDKYNDWNKLRERIKTIEGVEQVLTASDAYNLKKDFQNKVFNITRIFPDEVQSQSELDSLLQVFHSLPIYKNLLYADSAQVMVMTVSMNKDVINQKIRETIVGEIESLAKDFGTHHDLDMHFSGLPYVRTQYAIMIKADLIKFIILAAAVLAIVLFLFFRSFKVVLFSLFVVLLGVACSLGMIVLLDYKITLLTGMIPTVIIVIGIPNCVFLLNKYHQEYLKHGNKIKALQRTIQKVGNAIFLTNLTTAAGFATFMIIQNRILNHFGQVASLNILVLFVISITLIPIIFSFLPPPGKGETRHLENKWIKKVVNWFVIAVTNKRIYIFLSVTVFMIFAIIGISRIKATGYIVDDIPKDHPLYVDLKFFEKHMNGVMPLEILIDTHKPNGVLQMTTLKKVEALQKKLKTYPQLSPSFSVVDGLKFARQAYFNGIIKHYRMPSNQEKNFILSYLKGQDDNNHLLTSFVDSLNQKLRVSMRVEDIGTYGMRELQDSIQNDLNRFFPPEKYSTSLTGSSLTFSLGTSYLVRNLFWSLGLAVLLISLFMAIMFKSLRMVIISILPNILPLVITAGLMGFFGIPIKMSTVLVFSVAFGISVDTAIHFLAKYRQELLCFGVSPEAAVLNAIKEVGVSIIYTVIVLFLGFGIFVASDFGGTVAMGILVSITLFVAVFSNLLLVPSLLIATSKNAKIIQ